MKKIAIDIDNTICNTSAYFRPFAEEYNNKVVNRNCIINEKRVLPRSEEWTEEELNYFLDNVFYKEVINIPLKEDVSLYINKLKDMGYEIMFITNRGIKEGDITDKIVPEYLDKNNIPYDSIITKANDKYKYLTDCEFFIDDLVTNCESVLNNTNCKVIMMASDQTKDYSNDKIYKANNWQEVYNYIINNRGV